MKWDGVAMLESFSAITFLMKNGGEDRPLAACACTVDELESLLSRDFFCNLPDRTEKTVEAVVHWEDWGLKNTDR